MSQTKIICIFLIILYSDSIRSQNSDSIALPKNFDYYLTKSNCYKNLEFLTTKIESRLSGLQGAVKAVYFDHKNLSTHTCSEKLLVNGAQAQLKRLNMVPWPG